MHENEIGTHVVNEAIQLHKDLGPGLFEIVYEVTLARRLERRGLAVTRQDPVPIVYEGEHFDEGFRTDIIVEGKVILELKSIEKVLDVHKKQLLTYLKLTNLKLGYLLNFGAPTMKEGITRIVNGRL